MRYIHTLVPLLMYLDPLFTAHEGASWHQEFLAGKAIEVGYLSWNFWCWWLLRQPPYPLQKRIYQLGILPAALCYLLLVLFADALWVHLRYMRTADDLASRSVAAMP